MTKPGKGDAFYRMNGAGEMLVFSAADYENLAESSPELANAMENELKDVVELLVRNRWPFRIHATYDESITRFLNVFEEVNDGTPFNGIHWFFDHAETISEHNIQRVRNLNEGIPVQNRMAFQCEHFVARYGEEAATQAPPVRRMMDMGIPRGCRNSCDESIKLQSVAFAVLAHYWQVSRRCTQLLGVGSNRARIGAQAL
jgi:predicted amidohydrolase YtcJ